MELGAALLGVALGGFFFSRVVYWLYGLWNAIDDYRIAVAYPHLGRRKPLLVFLPLLLLHSGPWLLIVGSFVIYELFRETREAWHFWFVGGFMAQVLFLSAMTLAWVLRRQRSARPQGDRK